MNRARARRIGNVGDLTSASDHGAPSVRITAHMGLHGTISHMITPALAPIDGTKMVWPGFAIDTR